jgi:hypothetical protein
MEENTVHHTVLHPPAQGQTSWTIGGVEGAALYNAQCLRLPSLLVGQAAGIVHCTVPRSSRLAMGGARYCTVPEGGPPGPGLHGFTAMGRRHAIELS